MQRRTEAVICANPKKEAWSLGAGFLMGVNKIAVDLQPGTNQYFSTPDF